MRKTLAGATIALVTVCVGLTGCLQKSFIKEVAPSTDEYQFIRNHAELFKFSNSVYPSKEMQERNRQHVYQAHVSNPANDSVVCFAQNNQAWEIPIKDFEGNLQDLKFIEGVYPFQIYNKKTDETGQTLLDCSEYSVERYSGAMVFYNYSDDIEFATFGRNKDTELFSLEVLAKADSGLLGYHTIAFDGSPRISYWVGNRSKPFNGGSPTMELDFSATPLKALKINGEPVTNRIAQIDVYKVNDAGYPEKAKHQIYMQTEDGTVFEGYIKDLSNNEFSAFMKIPCTLPNELFEAAAKGTVAKFDIISRNSKDQETRIGQILFGLKR